MADMMLEQRVTNLEEAMAEMAQTVARTSASVERLSLEMREFKEESRLSREKSEASLQEYRAEQQAMRREFNQQQGEIANKLGTLAEDLGAPSLPCILQEVVPCPAGDGVSMAVRVRRYHPTEVNHSQEYDVIVSCGKYTLFNETKSRLRPSDVDHLIERLNAVRLYFPEYEGMTIIGSLASLYVDPSLVRYANRQGILVLATGDELMDVLNEPGLKLREF